LLTGSPVSVIISDTRAEAGNGRFGFFEFALTGIPLLIGTVAIVMLLAPRLLPHRNAAAMPRDLTQLDTTLRHHYRVDGEVADRLFSRRYGASEVMVPPRSRLIGQPAYPGMVTESGELVVIAVARGDERLDEPTTLAAGDTLLVRGTWQALSRQISADDEVRVIDPPDLIRRQAVPLGVGAKESVAVLTLMVVLLATELVPPAVAALGAACVLVILNVLTIERAFAAINWTTVVLVAGMIPLSTAMRTSGAADDIADSIVELVGDAGPYPLLFALFVVSSVLGQLISSTATALIIIPIALSAATELDVSVTPMLMSLNVAFHAALLTPVATPANLMVMEPGGYRFGDYWKLGLVVMAWYLVVSVLVVPLIWPL
jgi:di/tricarboxylate transporter